jgi:hypothetical protein
MAIISLIILLGINIIMVRQKRFRAFLRALSLDPRQLFVTAEAMAACTITSFCYCH